MTDEEWQALKMVSVESYLLKKFGSLHDAWIACEKQRGGPITIDAFLDTLQMAVDIEDRKQKFDHVEQFMNRDLE